MRATVRRGRGRGATESVRGPLVQSLHEEPAGLEIKPAAFWLRGEPEGCTTTSPHLAKENYL